MGPLDTWMRSERRQDTVVLKEARRKLGREGAQTLPGQEGAGWGQAGPGQRPRLPVLGPGIHPSSAAVGLCDLSASPSCLPLSICAVTLLSCSAANFCETDIKPGKWSEEPPRT